MRLSIHHVTTTAYLNQSNGMLEWAQRQLKDALRSRLAGEKWVLHLPWVVLGPRAAPKEDGNGSSVELMFGCLVTVPASFLPSQSRRRRRSWRTYRPQDAAHHTAVFHGHGCVSFPALQAAKFVYIRNSRSVLPLSPP